MACMWCNTQLCTCYGDISQQQQAQTLAAMQQGYHAVFGPPEGRKDDGADSPGLPEKPRWDLLPWKAVEEVVLVLQHGAKKYGDRNWEQVPQHRRRYFAAAIRHLTAWFLGEKVDKESGRSHLAHAATCILFLLARDEEP